MFYFWGVNPPFDDTTLVELNYKNRLIFYHNNDAICIIKKNIYYL